MDPHKCLHSFAVAVLTGDRDAANEHYLDLRKWLIAGGFEPRWSENGLPSRKLFHTYNMNTGTFGGI